MAQAVLKKLFPYYRYHPSHALSPEDLEASVQHGGYDKCMQRLDELQENLALEQELDDEMQEENQRIQNAEDAAEAAPDPAKLETVEARIKTVEAINAEREGRLQAIHHELEPMEAGIANAVLVKAADAPVDARNKVQTRLMEEAEGKLLESKMLLHGLTVRPPGIDIEQQLKDEARQLRDLLGQRDMTLEAFEAAEEAKEAEAEAGEEYADVEEISPEDEGRLRDVTPDQINDADLAHSAADLVKWRALHPEAKQSKGEGLAKASRVQAMAKANGNKLVSGKYIEKHGLRWAFREDAAKALKSGSPIVINLDDRKGPGTHWTAACLKGKTLYYADPFGSLLNGWPPAELKGLGKRVLVNTITFQHPDSSLCGYYSMCFAQAMACIDHELTQKEYLSVLYHSIA
jgi:hypothetical protein